MPIQTIVQIRGSYQDAKSSNKQWVTVLPTQIWQESLVLCVGDWDCAKWFWSQCPNFENVSWKKTHYFPILMVCLIQVCEQKAC